MTHVSLSATLRSITGFIVDPNKAEKLVEETKKRMRRMKVVKQAAIGTEYIELNFDFGGKQVVGFSCLVVKASAKTNDRTVAYGVHTYGWTEDENYALNPKYWESEKRQKLMNWAKYQATDKVVNVLKAITTSD